MSNLKGPAFLFCAFFLAGTGVISARFVRDSLGTFTITTVSLFCAILFLVPMCHKKLILTLKVLTARDYLFLSLQALCGIFLFRLFLLTGLSHTSAGEAGMLTGATPALTAVLAITVLKEPAHKKTFAGILCTITGILLIQGLFSRGLNLTPKHFWGNMLVLCAAASESSFNLISRVFSVRKNRVQPSAMVQTTIVSALAFLFCLIPALFENPVRRLQTAGLFVWPALVWYGVFVTALAFIFWYAGIRRAGAITAAAFSGLMPFTSLLLSVLLFRVKTGVPQWLGAALIIGGMVLIGGEKRTADKASKRPDIKNRAVFPEAENGGG
jgi:drug/metabolite transporter (DMT)-like permease